MTQELRVLHVMSGDVLGGAETAFVDLITALSEEKGVLQQAVIRPHEGRERQLSVAGVPVAQLPFRERFGGKTSAGIREVAKSFEPQIVHCWMARAASMTPVGPYVKLGWLGGYYKAKYFKGCQRLVGVTRDVIRHLEDQGWQDPRGQVIPTFCEIEPHAKPLDRAEFQTPEGAPLLLALGRLHSDKSFDILLKALVPLKGVYLWIAGEGELRGELESLTQALGLEDRVRFLGWRTDRGSLLKTCDVCAFPSRVEGFGTVMIEAWAYKVPFVTAESPGPKAHVRHRENGLIVPIDDVEALSCALHEALTNKALAQHMREMGYKDYETSFTKKYVTQAYLSYYKSLII